MELIHCAIRRRSYYGGGVDSRSSYLHLGVAMAINTQKVIVGGLAAGVVMNVVDFVVNMFVVGDRMKNEMNAVAPGLAEKMVTTSAMVTYIVMDFVLGILLVWLY